MSKTQLALIAAAVTFGIYFSFASQILAQNPSVEERHSRVSFRTDDQEKTVKVLFDTQLFTVFNYGGETKPFLHPVIGPSGLRMTRDFPMKKTIGEADDHPHHKSIWIGHEINGIDFWANKGGKILILESPVVDRKRRIISVKSVWTTNSGKAICRDQTKWRFGATENSRWIDCQFTLIASETAIEINDTKEGTVAIRTHPSLRLKPDAKRGVKEVTGNAFNSEGKSGPSIWGKSAAWVAYTGTIESNPASILLIDHPSNFRHPTTWHARDYGLVAANPFGLSAFQGLKKSSGAVPLLKNQRVTLRYRIQFFDTIVDAQECEDAFKRFANSIK